MLFSTQCYIIKRDINIVNTYLILLPDKHYKMYTIMSRY